VNILLSEDSGDTFAIVLASNTPNDGSQVVALPNRTLHFARIMVEAADNIFFSVSASDFTISPARASVVVVRHADRGGDKDLLTESGHQRAAALASLLADVPFDDVYSTDSERTRGTAKPTAGTRDPLTYADVGDIVSKTLTLSGGSRILIVGHSNTVPGIVARLGGPRFPTIESNNFSNIYLLGLQEEGPPIFKHLRYEYEVVDEKKTIFRPLATQDREADLQEELMTLEKRALEIRTLIDQ
jgi:broad specificity phosphatase PhoE